MNVQPMTLDINSLRAPQKPINQQVKGKKEDAFSVVLEKSREKQEAPSKLNKEQEKLTGTSKEKVETDSKASDTKETDKSKEIKSEEIKSEEIGPEDEVSAKEKNDKVTQEIANLLNITVSELEQMLETLQISISDLLKGDNLQQLMMQVHGVEEPMDLLQIPDIISDIKAISSVITENTANTADIPNMVEVEPGAALLDATLEAGQVTQTMEADSQEYKIKPEAQVAAGNNQKNTDEAPKVAVEGTAPELSSESTPNINIATPNDENSSQNEEQAGSNQNNSATQFLDNLSQSMGEVFQSQNNHVTESFETIAARNEVIDPRVVLDQIVEKIKVSSLENEAKMNIQLKPEHLGKLSVEVISKQGIMTAQITVENEKTKAILEQNIESLRESLEDKGLVIQGLEVAVGQNQNENQQAYSSPKSNRNISDIINAMMNEDVVEDMNEEKIKPDNLFDNDTNEVDFIA